jgi:hypothetical protein
MAKFLFLCGDIELNPGDTFDFCVWNYNSLIAHNFTLVSLIETYGFDRNWPKSRHRKLKS